MILGYESLKAKVNNSSGEKCKNVILATYCKSILLLLFFVFFYTQYTIIMFASQYAKFFLLMYILVMVYLVFVLVTNRVGIGINDEKLVYVRFSRIGFKTKKVYCIDFNNIKYLDVKKMFGSTSVKMSFIDGSGRLVKTNFRYTSVVFGISNNEQKKNGKIICDKLIELQKVLDRGDF